jgi:septal ring factor EnvC (AmiA/AmiB activator)
MLYGTILEGIQGQLNFVAQALAAINRRLSRMERRMTVLEDKIAELKADVEAEEVQVVAAQNLLAQLFQLLQAALNAPVSDAAKVVSVQQIIDKVVPDTVGLANAIVSNTPASGQQLPPATPPA